MNASYNSVLEQLEPRLAPAGVIAVSVNAGGTLVLGTVPGLDGDERVTIEGLSDGTYRLTPDAGVQLRIGGLNFNTPQIISGVTAGLTANLGAGDDAVTLNNAFFAKAVSINLGNGTNGFTMTDSNIGGAFSYTGGEGGDGVIFSGNFATVGGIATIKLGGGADDVTGTADRLNFGLGLTIDGGGGDDEVRLANSDGDDLAILGNFTFVGGAGDDVLSFGFANAGVLISGALKLTDVTGNESVLFAGSRVDVGALSLAAGSGNNTLLSTVTDFLVAKTLQWTSGSGTDDVDFNGSHLRVGGAVSISVGTGGGDAELTPLNSLYVGGTVMVSGSGANRDLDVNASEVFIGGKVTLAAGVGDGSARIFALNGMFLGGGANLTCGAGDTNLTISGNFRLVSNGSLTLTNGGGLGGTSVFIGGTSTASTINGAVTLKGGAFVSLEMMGTISGAVNLSTASLSAASNITIDCFTVGTLHIGGAVKLSTPTLAGQTGSIRINSAIFDNTLTVMGGAGVETLTINNSVVNKAFTASLGAGNDLFSLEQVNSAGASNYRGAVMLKGGAGTDTFLLGGAGANFAINFGQKVTVDGGTENDALTTGASVTFAPGLPLMTVSVP
ncbi:beta strand repeat-containing protein [Prosthecobacter dejongeii]|uniref:Uncharacterized protein n=1 Tax=Prosthecobacter dejongeii TaxID=48465 RepID=A0A7W7YJJ3_9BACT|nr:hypothetical protein [Prosthecobacter dejongeii]MBB5037269.1 hypothetical protein [Prosthecobacter dejongeii]